MRACEGRRTAGVERRFGAWAAPSLRTCLVRGHSPTRDWLRNAERLLRRGLVAVRLVRRQRLRDANEHGSDHPVVFVEHRVSTRDAVDVVVTLLRIGLRVEHLNRAASVNVIAATRLQPCVVVARLARIATGPAELLIWIVRSGVDLHLTDGLA